MTAQNQQKLPKAAFVVERWLNPRVYVYGDRDTTC